MTETYSLAYTKAHLSELVDKVSDEQERITITRNGTPVAIIISPDELESMEETLDILSTPGAMEQIEQARRDIANGLGIDEKALREEFLNK